MYDETLAATKCGQVRGQIHEGVHTFRGIRYGKDTGPRRFLPPEAPDLWADVANALEYGPMAPQHDPRNPVRRATHPFNRMIGLTDDQPESEDCLFLNVWSSDPGGRSPVMVWVHSGGFATNSGSAPSTDGARLAREHGVVSVSFNHRLGPLGYTQVTDDPGSAYIASGNVGMLDIVAVLRWVHENIAAFGGDPDNVTLFGQSGGAMKISTLLAMPAAAGLFHRAILQSGATPHIRPLRAGREVARELYAAADVADGDVAALASLPLCDLMVASAQLSALHGLGAASPVVDGDLIPAPPHAEGSVTADVPLIIGDLDTEAGLFLFSRAERLRALTDAEISDRLTTALGDPAAAELVEIARAGAPDADGYEMCVALFSALLFTGPAEELVDLHARRASSPVRRYRITWRTPAEHGLLGAPHEADVALTFGNVDAARGLNGGGEDAHLLSATIRDAWTAFARTGRPDCASVPDWPAADGAGAAVLLTPEASLGIVPGAALTRAARRWAGIEVNWFHVFA